MKQLKITNHKSIIMSASNIQTTVKKIESMPEIWLQFAKELFSVPSTVENEKNIALFICKYLDNLNINYELDITGNILVTKGDTDIYSCYCSHMDTVHDYPDGFNIVIKKGRILAHDDNKKQVGCGGDDKCGIFTCLYLLSELENVKVAFFTKEETGGIGSSDVDHSFFNDCAFIASIDRWGNSDFICNYGNQLTCSEEFLKDTDRMFAQYNYKPAEGMFTDAFNLFSDGIGITCMNLSCGYYQHHTSQEYVDVCELWVCAILCKKLDEITNQRYIHKTVKSDRLIDGLWAELDMSDDDLMIEVLADYGHYTSKPVSLLVGMPMGEQCEIMDAFHERTGYDYMSSY